MLPRSSWGTKCSYEKCKKIEGKRDCHASKPTEWNCVKMKAPRTSFQGKGQSGWASFRGSVAHPAFLNTMEKRWEGPHSQTLQLPSESISPKESCFQAPSTLNDLTDSEASVCQSQATFLVLILGGFDLQQLEMGLWFPDRDWGQVVVVRAPNPSHYTSGQQQGPGFLALQKIIPTKTESSEKVKCFF